MAKAGRSRGGSGRGTRAAAAGRLPVQAVPLLETPPAIERPKRIHPRHLLPLIREGAERNVYSVSKEIQLAPAFMAARAAGDEIKLLRNTELTGPATNSTASNVGEPSCAINGDVVLYTGNWYAAVSTDGGATFQYMDPETAFPRPGPNIRFCCDQVVQYVPELDMFVWLLQYGPEAGDNIQRLAFAKTADAARGRWKVFDITTAMLGVPGAFLDFPDLAIGQNHLYMTTNIFAANDVGSAVVRISLASIRAGKPAETHFVSMELQSFRVAQNTGNVGYFAAHQDTSTLAVFAWPENAAAPTKTQVAVARWLGGNGYISRTPDGRRWLDRADPRITGATRSANELWFAWSVDARSNRRARPFIQIARIGLPGFTLIDNVNLFDANSATCYGALSTNADGEIGISYMIGGAQQFPSHVVGFLNRFRKTPDRRQWRAQPDRRSLDGQGGMGRLPDGAARASRRQAVRRHRLHDEGAGQWIEPRRHPALRDVRTRARWRRSHRHPAGAASAARRCHLQGSTTSRRRSATSTRSPRCRWRSRWRSRRRASPRGNRPCRPTRRWSLG